MKTSVRIGCGAGFSGDRLEPALMLVQQGELDYLVLECLAERTIALAQKRKRQDATLGYDPLLERRIERLLPYLLAQKVRLITNMGAANPLAAAQKIVDIAQRLSLPVRVAAVTGDDVFSLLSALETGQPLSASGPLISANAYLGIEAILPALATDANIIITGRVADPSLFLAPLVHEFGWSPNDYDLLGQGTVIGHLLECAGHLTGGYFADPGRKDVPDMAHLGHPFAEVSSDGTAVFGKVAGTGGLLNLATAKEQLLYEVMDPSQYLTPDVVADFTQVRLAETGPNQVRASGGQGQPRPDKLKVSVGYEAGFIGEGEISYAGANALGRAQLAGAIIQERLQDRFTDLRIDYIGSTSVHRTNFGHYPAPYEIRLRVAGRALTAQQAALVGEEVEALYTNGPAAGGGARKYVHELVGIVSTLIDRNQVSPHVTLFQS
ncbi:acyclic terpene utilization AtuA family protein [Rudanella paleaurantiibacter]|uniref:Acyclic terpene utilization AtuA family protein n=1 Tax=Rudanella paleaurantiibacter TaxID=2614655 RepID=A0A7J5TT01_9BACT|nr:acyclic terpene utilization AtuA family protein [Rudanella paleaurantiibacter]KAB7726836.1 acyclic terpene utilization AtuA family protein [Rudanella paleaurantiibacter]